MLQCSSPVKFVNLGFFGVVHGLGESIKAGFHNRNQTKLSLKLNRTNLKYLSSSVIKLNHILSYKKYI